MYNEGFIQQGWQCPVCKKVYAPGMPWCFTCPPKVETSGTTKLKVKGWRSIEVIIPDLEKLDEK